MRIKRVLTKRKKHSVHFPHQLKTCTCVSHLANYEIGIFSVIVWQSKKKTWFFCDFLLMGCTNFIDFETSEDGTGNYWNCVNRVKVIQQTFSYKNVRLNSDFGLEYWVHKGYQTTWNCRHELWAVLCASDFLKCFRERLGFKKLRGEIVKNESKKGLKKLMHLSQFERPCSRSSWAGQSTR